MELNLNDSQSHYDENKKSSEKRSDIVPLSDSDYVSRELGNSKPSALLILLVVVASVSHLMFGYDTGYISSALVSIRTDLDNKELSYGEQELITSATSLGAFLGSAITFWLADQFGRKKVTMGANVFFISGAGVQCGSHRVWEMIGGRFIMGWGVGIGSVIAPLYITELSPPQYRGRLVIMASIIRTGAQLLSYGVGAALEPMDGGWRILVGISMIPTTLQFILLFWLPDSPRYLVKVGQLDKARDVIARTHKGANAQDINMKVEELIEQTKSIFAPNTPPWKKVFKMIKEIHTVPSNFRALIIGCGLQGINQFTGFNSLMYFSSTIFKTIGFSDATAVSIIVAGTSFAFTLVVFFLIDRIGRRLSMIISLYGMIVALVLCSIAFHFMNIKFVDNSAVVQSSKITGWGVLIIVSMMLYVAFYAIGVGAVPWQQSELFPMSVRSLGSSYSCMVNWAGSLIIAATFLTMMENITPTGTFAFFAGISFLSLIFVYFCFPELSNMELEETQEVLKDGFNIKKSVRISKERKRQQKENNGGDVEFIGDRIWEMRKRTRTNSAASQQVVENAPQV